MRRDLQLSVAADDLDRRVLAEVLDAQAPGCLGHAQLIARYEGIVDHDTFVRTLHHTAKLERSRRVRQLPLLAAIVNRDAKHIRYPAIGGFSLTILPAAHPSAIFGKEGAARPPPSRLRRKTQSTQTQLPPAGGKRESRQDDSLTLSHGTPRLRKFARRRWITAGPRR